MKKLILLSALLATFMIACKKKKEDKSEPEPANVAPTASISNPANNSSSNAQNITISATASDTDGSIAKVEFYDGTTKLGEDTTAPYSLDVSLDPGTYTFTVKAYDNKNASATSATVNYTVTQVVVMQPA